MERFLVLIPALLCLVAGAPAFAWIAGDACTVAGDVLFGAPSLICNGSTLQVFEGSAVNPTRAGIATNTPATTLDVNGEIRISNTGIACSGSIAGGMRYNSSSGIMQFCDGATWGGLGASVSIDGLSDAITQYSSGGSMYLGSGVGASSSGGANTALGYNAFATNAASQQSTAFGYEAMRYANSTGSATITNNTALGYQALRGSTTASANTGIANTAIGYAALKANTSGGANVAVGPNALGVNIDGDYNNAVGNGALHANTSGSSNVAVGDAALYNNTTSNVNVAIGANALFNNTGSDNTAVGSSSLYGVTTGSSNTAVGEHAGNAGTAITTGSNNTFIGYQAQSNGSGYTNATAIGNGAVVKASNTMQFGNASVTDVYFGTHACTAGVACGAGITTSTAGAGANAVAHAKAWNTNSDRRLKKDIAASDLGLDFIKRLRPVSYHFREGDQLLNYGFIAQEVEHALGGRQTAMVMQQNDAMKTYELNYPEIISPLVKAVQEQQDLLAAQEAAIRDLQQKVNQLVATHSIGTRPSGSGGE